MHETETTKYKIYPEYPTVLSFTVPSDIIQQTELNITKYYMYNHFSKAQKESS